MLLPCGAMFEPGVENRAQLTLTGGQRQLRGLAGTTQTRVEGVEERIVPHGHPGAPREHGTPVGPAAPHGPFAPPGAAIPVAGGDPDPGRARLPAQGPPCWEVGEQRRREHRSHAGGALEQVVWRPPHRAGPHGLVQVVVQRREAALQPGERRVTSGLERVRGAAQAIVLGGEPVEPLAAPGQLGAQRRGVGLRSGPRRRPHGLGHVGEARGSQGLGLGQPARGCRNLPGWARIDHHDGPPGGGQGGSHGHFQAAGSCQHAAGRLEDLQPGHEGTATGVIVRAAPTLCGGP